MTATVMELLSDFHFLRPWWFAALPLAFLPLLVRRAGQGAGGWHRVIAPELLPVLLDRGGAGSRRARTTFHVLACSAFCTAVCALAGPTLERLPQPVATNRDAAVIVLDLSLSMYTPDTQPSRIARAHAAIAGMLTDREDGLTGLVVYAGDAHVVTPLTDDPRNIENLLPALVPDIMPAAGSRPGPAIAAARRLFPNVGATQGQIVLVTDGVDEPDDVLRHRDPAFPISIVGVGTPQGGAIPLDFRGVPGRFLTDESGATVHTRLNAARLADLARGAYGEYRTLDSADAPWTWRDTPRPRAAQPDRTFDTWHDVGFWLVLPVLALVCLGFRRGVLVGLACLLIAPVGHAETPGAPATDTAIGAVRNLWQRPDQQAYEMLRGGRAEAAARRFEDPRWAAVAQYRAGDLEGAADRFRADDTPTGYYNLGTALARLGALSAAVAAYERVLATAPDHADARHNRDLVAALLAQGAQEEDADGADAGLPEGLDAAHNENAGARTEPDAGMRGAGGDAGTAPPTDATSDPRSADARVRWLDSVPDDPGGLLRRKFRYETNQRLRQGDYRSRERGPTW